jgi:hypothetical protein
MLDILAIALMSPTKMFFVSPGSIPVLTLLDLLGGSFVLTLGFSVRPDFCGRLPAL